MTLCGINGILLASVGFLVSPEALSTEEVIETKEEAAETAQQSV